MARPSSIRDSLGRVDHCNLDVRRLLCTGVVDGRPQTITSPKRLFTWCYRKRCYGIRQSDKLSINIGFFLNVTDYMCFSDTIVKMHNSFTKEFDTHPASNGGFDVVVLKYKFN